MQNSEDPNNIVMVCKDCGDMRKQDWQDHNKDKIIKIGDFVKIALQDSSKSRAEHCWIKITKVGKDGKTMEGFLDNIPIYLKKYVYGDNISLRREDIEDHTGRDGK